MDFYMELTLFREISYCTTKFRRILYRFVYTEFRRPLNVICAESFKNKSIFKFNPLTLKLSGNFVIPKVVEFRRIGQIP
jgi:hypothetical protein